MWTPIPRWRKSKLYDRKTPITVADRINDHVVPSFHAHEIKLLRVPTDRGTEYCGNPERHKYELYRAIENIDHSPVAAPRPLRRIKSRILMLITLGPGGTFKPTGNHYADSRGFYSEVIAQEVTWSCQRQISVYSIPRAT